jgi:hypothetical protein
VPDTPPDDTPEPLTKSEPVVVGDIADLVIVLAGTAGVLIPDDVAAKVVSAIVAVILWVQSTYFKRQAVTPDARAQEKAARAYEDGLETGQQQAPAVATVVQVSGDPDVSHIEAALRQQVTGDREWVVPRLDPIPPAPTRTPPPVGLDA